MSHRRRFLQLATAAVPVAAATTLTRAARADDGSVRDFLGAWDVIHSLPIPPGHFRELLTFSDGGVFFETNSFLNTASNLDFSAFGLPDALNASDGIGAWERAGRGVIRAVLRKLLFDGARQNIGDLRATGTVRSDGLNHYGVWHVEVVNLAGQVLVDFGQSTTEGTRIR